MMMMVMPTAVVVLSPVRDEPPTTALASPPGGTLLGAFTPVAPVGALDEPVGAVHRAGHLCRTLRRCGGITPRPPARVPGRGAHAHLAPEAVLGEAIGALLEATVVGTLDVLPAGLTTPGAAGCACSPLGRLTFAGDAVVLAHDVLLASGAGRGAVDGGAVGVEGHAGTDGAVVLRHEAVGAVLAAGAGWYGAGARGLGLWRGSWTSRCCWSDTSCPGAAAVLACPDGGESVTVAPAPPVNELLAAPRRAVVEEAGYVRPTHAPLTRQGAVYFAAARLLSIRASGICLSAQ